jgi:hypothetical protein
VQTRKARLVSSLTYTADPIEQQDCRCRGLDMFDAFPQCKSFCSKNQRIPAILAGTDCNKKFAQYYTYVFLNSDGLDWIQYLGHLMLNFPSSARNTSVSRFLYHSILIPARQSHVVEQNLWATMQGRTPSAKYDGYGACPMMTSYRTGILAEFLYDKKPCETFPFDQVNKTLVLRR